MAHPATNQEDVFSEREGLYSCFAFTGLNQLENSDDTTRYLLADDAERDTFNVQLTHANVTSDVDLCIMDLDDPVFQSSFPSVYDLFTAEELGIKPPGIASTCPRSIEASQTEVLSSENSTTQVLKSSETSLLSSRGQLPSAASPLKIIHFSMAKFIEKQSKKQIDKPRTGKEMCVRCRLDNKICIDYPICRRCYRSRRYRQICYRSETITSPTLVASEAELKQYECIVGPTVRTCLKQIIGFKFGNIASITIPIRKIEHLEENYLRLTMWDSGNGKACFVNTPPYVTTLDTGKLVKEMKHLLLEQFLPHTIKMIQGMGNQDIYAQSVLAAYRRAFFSNRDEEEREMVSKALQLVAASSPWDNSTMEFEKWFGDENDRPKKNDFKSWSKGLYMAPKLVNAQFNIALNKYCAKIQKEVVAKLSNWEQDKWYINWHEKNGRYDAGVALYYLCNSLIVAELNSRIEHLFNQLRVEFWKSCWRKPFKLDWDKKENHAHVNDEKDAVEFMKTVGKLILKNEQKLTAARYTQPEYNLRPGYEDIVEQVTGSMTSWLVFD